MGRRTFLVAFCLSALSVSICAGQDSPVFFAPEHTPAPAFTLSNLEGQRVSSKDFAGKVAVLSFGATWCASCVSELKSLERLRARFPGELLVYFIAIDGRGEKDVKPFMEKNGFRVPTLIDPRMEVARAHDIRWVPVTLVLDHQGVVVGRAIGPRDWDGKEALNLIQPLVKRSHLSQSKGG